MGADLWRLMEDENGMLVLSDMFVDDWVTPVLDTVQNVELLTAQQTAAGRTSFSFERKLITCDGGANRVNHEVGNQDFDIRSHEVGNMIYAWGNNHASFSYHGTTRRGYAAGFAFGDSTADFGGALVMRRVVKEPTPLRIPLIFPSTTIRRQSIVTTRDQSTRST